MSLTENHTIAELLYENGKLSAELEEIGRAHV